ncbi:MAG: hypothetical protein SFU25_09540 [Candidatus Caenarcaniphilales bacterium]|nr:hypothetical protein [Candidatus Caenarcaniphilales bacterium]
MGNSQQHWKDWNPGLNNGNLTLKEVLNTLPGNKQEQIHFLVKLLENPQSKLALPGSVDLFNHDCIHILLGRGLLPQDEAFVIGFTMGCSKGMNPFYRWIYEIASSNLYPPIYRFDKNELQVYNLALKAGEESGTDELHKVDFKALLNSKVQEIRNLLKIDLNYLLELYEKEASLVPLSKATQRLPLKNQTI